MADWSRKEVDAIVADYFAMLRAYVAGETVNKSAHRRALLELLPGRNASSIEFKHANITAALNDLGVPGIDGYKPRGNYQSLLLEVASEKLRADGELALLLENSVTAEASAPAKMAAFSPWEDPPVRAEKILLDRLRESDPRRTTRITHVDYLGREAQNASLGRQGELFVLDLEQRRLWQAGKNRLAGRVEHVAASGDGHGYDIRSYETDGRERLIEVKNTAFSKTTPFFVTRNELEVSRARANEYHLYRVFKFRTTPKLFSLNGALDKVCELDPVQFSGRVA